MNYKVYYLEKYLKMSAKKKLPLGGSDFQRIIKDGYYFIDKSLLIKEIISDGSEVILLPRPRRFGKTLNMSMLKYFFERQPDGSNSRELFQGLKIWREADCRAYCGEYPIIFLTFKDVKMMEYPETFRKLKKLISEIFQQNFFLLESGALNEYDTPIQSAYQYGYFKEMMLFIRNLLCGGLKDNQYLEKGILTGILKVAKESIFSGLNNLNVATILDIEYSQLKNQFLKISFTERSLW